MRKIDTLIELIDTPMFSSDDFFDFYFFEKITKYGMYRVIPFVKTGGVFSFEKKCTKCNELFRASGSKGKMFKYAERLQLNKHTNHHGHELDECDNCYDILSGDKEGYVYLLEGENGRYKIGCSKHPEKRAKTLCMSSCENHVLVHTIETSAMRTLESKLHDRFIEKRSHSEWFNLSVDDVNYIKGLK